MGEVITRILLVRHGATEWNVNRRAQGQADIPLNDQGRREAVAAAERLARWDVDAVYASDLSRAVDTAARIASEHGVEVVTDPAFREIDQGEWEGLGIAEIARRWPDLWGPGRHHAARPGGESPSQVRRRALEAIARIVERHSGGTVVLVSHGGPIRWIVAEALGYGDRDSALVRGLQTGGVVSLEARLEDGKLSFDGVTRLDGASPEVGDPDA